MTAIKASSELRRGDTVKLHGMLVTLDRGITDFEGTNGPAFASRGKVINIGDLDQLDPWLARFVRSDSRDDDEGDVRWTIQGNDLVRWVIDTDVPTDQCGACGQFTYNHEAHHCDLDDREAS